MVENLKENLKNNFTNSPKAKIIIGAVSALLITLIVTLICMRKNIKIIVDGKKEAFITYKGTVKDILAEKGIEIAPKDKVQPALDEKISSKDIINIKRAVEVEMVVANKTIVIKTAEDTIKDMIKSENEELRAEGIEFNEEIDEITPSLDTEISDNLTIQLVKVEITNEVATEDINYETVVEEDENLDINNEDIRQAGEAGQKEITYKVVKKDGKEVSREVVQSKVVKEPVNEIIAQGTRRVFASRDGNMEYKDLIYCESTAYAGDGITATGTVPSYNPGGISTIAVDPRVIPLGSLVYVEGYGKAIASDTGGLIRGNIIDVFLNSELECRSWGRKYNVPVYILAYPGEW